ncbi:arsenic resistance N-acetyltransferase ArsN2 [Haliea sp. E1-2-M8]|uniref:arsenic resistance N-acetyltransferase ArsN2 n=1 Tax=Haliea sp. E1-2-M8 TaxID=3064706 RepID=UPI0027273107|nr:arsenic resistance N-acetyltransferase ArsN2 [Haliea sp. E1-2-M8]MDO8860318.1 arsenic resistance N-acetyltransferase ArsN2 [Haliea sp. E1-2-M8]
MKTELIELDAEVKALLLEAGLPVSDLSGKASLSLLGARKKDGQLLGVVGIEASGTEGLLRSLAVAPTARGAGLGQHLVSEAEAWAVARGITALYLLTTTADEFFVRLGYKSIARDEAPTSIAVTAEFRELCPAASAFMRKVLVAKRQND